MCGIAGAVGSGGAADAATMMTRLRHRGPDAEGVYAGDGFGIAHTRLAIRDLDERSNCPFIYGGTVLVYNGELWNAGPLATELREAGRRFTTTGDTEVVAAALEHWGPAALRRFEGMFALAWARDGVIRIARDRWGEVPLHVAYTSVMGTVERAWFASELKAFPAEVIPIAEWVSPGEVVTFTPQQGGTWDVERELWYAWQHLPLGIDDVFVAEERLRDLIRRATFERSVSDVPVCTLLSGGIDSAAVAYHLRQTIPNLVAYVAVLNPKSRDVRCAREVADWLGIELREVNVRPPTPDDLRRVVEKIELPHKAQVEIGWACLQLAERMRADGFKVTFSGEGSDELWASYGFAYHALASGEDWHGYRHGLFRTQHRKNFPRCNKVFMAHGVECRLPFLHTPLVEWTLDLPASLCYEKRPTEKRLIRSAYETVLPTSVTSRPKLAFQKGLGLDDHIPLDSPRRSYREWFDELYAA
jgi:asparagine synthase (glutamine-hydrolysing)